MTFADIPEEIKALHAQIVECDARQQTGLASALRFILDRQLRELGLVGQFQTFTNDQSQPTQEQQP